mmetsp:Transcript_6873/g.13822  ORF Transcript_6873/g.13822 Transcript_6873/m.13822 type:complete len:304 (-) Transcript_6873:343-1254(-)
MSGSLPASPSTCPTRRSARVRVGSILVPTPMRPPGTAYSSSLCSANSDTMRLRMGVHIILPSASFLTMPGRISISACRFSTPHRMDPPATPPRRSTTSSPGLFTSKDRMMIMRGSEVKSRIGTGMALAMYSATTSMLYRSCAEIGMIGDFSATVPSMNALIASYCWRAACSLTRSILFWRMMMFCSFMISTAAKCSAVCGCGHCSFPATSSSAASITAAPLSMVAIRMSWPGQSTKDTCRSSSHSPSAHCLSVPPGPVFTSYLHLGSPCLPMGRITLFLSSRNDALPKARKLPGFFSSGLILP